MQAEEIKAEKLDEMRRIDPVIKNSKEIWKGVYPRLYITITGENSDMGDNVQDMVNLLQLEQDPDRVAFLLDSIYKVRGIPVPPKKDQEPAETQLTNRNPGEEEGERQGQQPRQRQVERATAEPVVR